MSLTRLFLYGSRKTGDATIDSDYDFVAVVPSFDSKLLHEILMTVLVTAIKKGHTAIAIFLLRKGADPKLESHFDQFTPLESAVKYKNKEVLAELNSMGVRQSWFERFVSKILHG